MLVRAGPSVKQYTIHYITAEYAKELAELAGKLDEAGSHAAYHKVMDAVACFEKGNEMLAEVLKAQE